MRVAIVGASGRTGRTTVTRALVAGHEVIAVVRSDAWERHAIFITE